MSRTLAVVSALVPPDRLLHGHVNAARCADHLELRIDQDHAGPQILSEIQTCVQNAIIKLPEILIPGIMPTVTCHLERMHERLVDIELSPHLISIYLQHGIMPQAVADELAATIGYIIRHL